MNATYREQFKQENDIEAGLAQHWGYQLPNLTIDQKHQKQTHENMPVVANITMRKFSKEIQKTQKIKQVQDQIRALENQRMLRQLREQKYQQPSVEQKSEIINLMEQLIGDYNHIVEHKHLADQKIVPQSKQEKKNTFREQGTKALLNLIEQKRKQLISADLAQQIKLNKEIVSLYRKHNADNMSSLSLKNKSTSRQPISQQGKINKYQSQTFDNMPKFSSLNKYQSLKMDSQESLKKILFFKNKSNIEGLSQTQVVKKFKEMQMKRYGKVNRKQSLLFQQASEEKRGKKNKSLQKTIKSPFLDHKQSQSYKLMQNKIKSNSQALQVWRNKIHDNRSSRLQARRQYAQKQRKQTVKEKDRQQQLYEIIGKQIKIHNLQVNSNNIFAQETKYREKQHEQQKQHIFAELLRKKNNKFNRLWGTKILVKYNSEEQAKSLLKGESDKNPTRSANSASQQSNRSQKHSKSVRIDKSQEVNSFTPRERAGEGDEIDWKGEQKDEQHYWRMCKNEKINLLLKRR